MADKTADAYAVLGVSPNASSQQIRRAYKALCLRWHPDKHPPGSARRAAERQFKSISVAYTTVAERHSKRFTSANRHHSTATTSSSHSRNHFPSSAAAADFEDDAAFFFHDVCDSDDEDMHHYDGESSYRSTTRHQDFVLELPVTLPEYATGCVKQHRLPADDPDGTAKLLRVVVKPGYRPGDRIRFRHVRSDGGDVVFTLTQSTAAPWTDAKLLGDDVHITQRIQLVDALTGARISVCTPRGTRCMRVLPVIAPGATRVVPGCGLPCRGEPEQFGDVVVKFEVVFPSKVDDASKLKLRDVFSRMENSKMRRCSSVFSAKAFRRHEQQQKRTCSYCEREDYSEHTAHTDVPRGADMRGGVGSEDLKQHGAGSNERGGATQHQRLRTMFAKSSNKLASVFR
eukprot:TRINITY_DN957_c0_g1_i1.p2 TRINITY_DN957_c0_g1~~TRINITY_DN957_c0_g1_i1.p2  ORF type:complete len:433 (+),score=76.87 TRINITY_DN957_c0_g1_i1:100-1299(+)